MEDVREAGVDAGTMRTGPAGQELTTEIGRGVDTDNGRREGRNGQDERESRDKQRGRETPHG